MDDFHSFILEVTMTLQQLKYIIKIAQTGSMHIAADELYITQPNLSKSVKELEAEMGITIFQRTNKGVILTDEGTRFLSYARQVIEQSDLLEEVYKKDEGVKRSFAISSQHYAFVVNAFVELVERLGRDSYEFSLRECKTHEIIEDVRNGRSEIGVLYLSNFNQDIIRKVIDNNGLSYEPLFEAKPHIFISKSHPLAKKDSVSLIDLKEYPRFTYDQGIYNSFYYSEELHSMEAAKKNIVVSDRATLFNLLRGLDGYTISSGIMSTKLNGDDIISIPLESNEKMELIYIYDADKPFKEITKQYISILKTMKK